MMSTAIGAIVMAATPRAIELPLAMSAGAWSRIDAVGPWGPDRLRCLEAPDPDHCGLCTLFGAAFPVSLLCAVERAQQRHPQPFDWLDVAPLVFFHTVNWQCGDTLAIEADFVAGDGLGAHCNANDSTRAAFRQPLALQMRRAQNLKHSKKGGATPSSSLVNTIQKLALQNCRTARKNRVPRQRQQGLAGDS